MPRRKKRPARPSTAARPIVDSEGWTHIVKGPPPAESSDALLSSLKNLSLDAALTPAEVSSQQARYSGFWESSPCCRHLDGMIREDLPLASLPLSRCICLGLGSVVNGRHSPRHQLAALVWLHSVLRARCPSLSPQIIFQDPAFTPSDIAYLESLGHRVVETPAAFDMIDDTTFLFAPHLERGVYAAAVAGKKLPALSCSGDVKAFIEQMSYQSDDEHARLRDSETLQRFEDHMVGRDLSEYDRDPWWYCTRLFWRKDVAERAHG